MPDQAKQKIIEQITSPAPKVEASPLEKTEASTPAKKSNKISGKSSLRGIAGKKGKTGTPSAEAKLKPQKPSIDDAIKEVDGSDIPAYEKNSFKKVLSGLDPSKESDTEYKNAIVEGLKERGTQFGDESSLDRVRELHRIRGRKELSDDDAMEAADFFRQGVRGKAGSSVNKAAKLMAQEIFDRLSEPQQKRFAENARVNLGVFANDESLNNDPFVKRLRSLI